jgi:hypothetical protein
VGRLILTFATLSFLAVFAAAQEEPEEPVKPDPLTVADLTAAVANAAAIFSRSAPGLEAQETLHQHGRRGFLSVLEKGDDEKPKNLDVRLSPEFRTHDVISDYAFSEIGQPRAIHEIRSIISVDGRTISHEDEARHALAIGIQSPDDEMKHKLLENFERNRLEGAVTDFGQLLLLFSAAAQSHYQFTMGKERLLHTVPMIALQYKQVSGVSGLTTFRERVAETRPMEGEIWLRHSDLLPMRITMFTEKPLGTNLTIRDQAVIDYTPTPYGLAPAHLDYMQFLGSDLLVENDLQYSGYQRLTPGIVP